MERLAEYWPVIVALAALAGVAVVSVSGFLNRPTAEQIAAAKEWLLFATTQAEKELGGGTGKLKLRQVYDMFIQRFPVISRVVPFQIFSAWVDEALEKMKALLSTNTAVKEYVEGTPD